MSYIYECKNCGNSATFDQDDINWVCICDPRNRPKGVNQFFVCGTCSFRNWGRFDSCPQCFANKLSEKKITVEHFGDMKNMPVRSKEQRLDQFEKSYQRQEEIQRKIIQNKIDQQNAIIQTPILLKQILSKLEKEPEIKTDKDGYIIFNEDEDV